MDLSILNSKIDIISDLRLVWSNHRGSAEYDNNNNIITLWKIARKQLALDKWHPSRQVSTCQYLHSHTQCSPRPVPVSVSNHALPRLSIVIDWGQNQGRGPDTSFQNKQTKTLGQSHLRDPIGEMGYRRQSHFPVRICLFGYTWAVLLGRICLHPGLVCISWYPGSNQVAFFGLWRRWLNTEC